MPDVDSREPRVESARVDRDPALDRIVDRLRVNLRDAGIACADADIVRILELDLLRFVVGFDAVAAGVPADALPDHLGDPLRPDRAATDEGGSSAPISDAAADTIVGIAEQIRTRKVSPVELTRAALDRIALRDAELNAFQLVLTDTAIAAAREAEREIAAGGWRGMLHGVPIAIKDLLDLAGTPTTAGSRVRPATAAAADATAVGRLRQAGAVIVGKTRLAEFAYSPGSNNSTFGPTRNPHDPSRDTGGSSSGSAASVAAGMAFAALGSDTGGSIRIPGAQCGLVGLKPTYGRVSLAGAVPLSWSLDHVGPMTRSVDDAALLLGVLDGADACDPRTRDLPLAPWSAVRDRGVRGLTIGVVEDDGDPEPLASDEGLAAWRAGLTRLDAAGATLVPVALPMLATLRILNAPILATEAARYHSPALRARLGDYGEFARLRLIAAHAFAPSAYTIAQQAHAVARAALARALERIDLFSTPTMPGVAPPLGVPASTRHTAAINVLGWPAITVPAGRRRRAPSDSGGRRAPDGSRGPLPLGLQLVARPCDEATLLRAARAVERG